MPHDVIHPSAIDTQLSYLIQVSWIVLIPIGVLLTIVLFKLAFLLHNVTEFISIARYDLHPTIQELRLTVNHVEHLTQKAVNVVDTLEQSAKNASPVVKEALQKSWKNVNESVGSMSGPVSKVASSMVGLGVQVGKLGWRLVERLIFK